MREKGWRKKSRPAQDRKHVSWQPSSGERTEPSELVPFVELRRIKLSRPGTSLPLQPGHHGPCELEPSAFQRRDCSEGPGRPRPRPREQTLRLIVLSTHRRLRGAWACAQSQSLRLKAEWGRASPGGRINGSD